MASFKTTVEGILTDDQKKQLAVLQKEKPVVAGQFKPAA